jgi:ABC-2 type transport system permease protein
LQLSLTFIVPVGFAITVPAEVLVGTIEWRLVAFAVALATVMPALARLLWQRGIRLYAGASA